MDKRGWSHVNHFTTLLGSSSYRIDLEQIRGLLLQPLNLTRHFMPTGPNLYNIVC